VPVGAPHIALPRLYLWHWPVFVYLTEARTQLDGWQLFAVRFAVTILLSIASYELVERPIRERRWRTVAGVATAGAACAVVVAVVLTVVPGPRGQAAAEATQIRVEDSIGKRVFVVGDSVAFNLAYWEPPQLGGQPMTVGEATVLGCGVPIPEDTRCGTVFDDWRASVETFDPDLSVLAIGRWELEDRVINGEKISPGSRRSAALISRSLDEGLDILTARGGRVALLSVPSCFPTPGASRRYDAEAAAWLDDIFRDAAAAHAPLVDVVDYGALLCPSGPSTERGPIETEADGAHLTEAGATGVWEWLGTQPVATAPRGAP
jgi:hypothetical protein